MKLKESLELLLTCIYPDHLDDQKVTEAMDVVQKYADGLHDNLHYAPPKLLKFPDCVEKK
jgi:hypothetical protein|tara:strand:- start:391 stop:570 length:180 start_codon:yes stop_codon:yes gene_type:complete